MIKVKYKKGFLSVLILIYLCYTLKVAFQMYGTDYKYYNVLHGRSNCVLTLDNGTPSTFLNNINKKVWIFVDNPHTKVIHVLDIDIVQAFIVLLSVGVILDLRKRIMEQNSIKFNGSKYKDGGLVP